MEYHPHYTADILYCTVYMCTEKQGKQSDSVGEVKVRRKIDFHFPVEDVLNLFIRLFISRHVSLSNPFPNSDHKQYMTESDF